VIELARTEKSVEGQPGKSALIVIDVQTYFVNWHTKNLPKRIAGFIKRNEGKFDFVIFTRFVNKKDSNFVKCLDWRECFDPTQTGIHPELLDLASKNIVFEKTSYSIFKSKPLKRFLRENGIKRLVLCGIDIDACVLASAFEAFDLGYDVKILAGLSLSHSGGKLNEAALEIIKKNLQK
jgi:nicotinamidase-related amidase